MDFLKSKKVIATVIAILVALIGNINPEWVKPVEQILWALAAYILGQGFADAGKEAAKLKEKQ